MAFENLTEREKQILYNLITHYINSADPVGSRVIAHRFRMGISSATIRNTLQDLEELGLVEQPHVSAGRIPTDLGYRVYVDYLLKREHLTAAEMEAIRSEILKEGRGINEILGQTCKVLGDITKQLGVSIAPRFEEGVLKRLELIPVSDERLMVVVVVRSGLARSIVLEVEAAILEKDLREVESILNERLSGLTLGRIRRTISDRLADVSGSARLLNVIIDSKDKIWKDQAGEIIRTAGVDYLLLQPEFSSIERVSELLKLLQNSNALSEFLRDAPEAGLLVTIGKENKFAEIMKCSLVTSSYRVGSIAGAVGIVGPTRMPYSKLVSIVQYTARTITEALSGIDEEKSE